MLAPRTLTAYSRETHDRLVTEPMTVGTSRSTSPRYRERALKYARPASRGAETSLGFPSSAILALILFTVSIAAVTVLLCRESSVKFPVVILGDAIPQGQQSICTSILFPTNIVQLMSSRSVVSINVRWKHGNCLARGTPVVIGTEAIKEMTNESDALPATEWKMDQSAAILSDTQKNSHVELGEGSLHISFRSLFSGAIE